MAEPDEQEQAPDPLANPDGTRKPDLRCTEQERRNVRVERQLDGSGHLARGDRTRMSVMNFSSRHPPRTERDPEFEFRPPPPAPPAAPSPEPATGAPEPASEPAPTLLERVKKAFGL